MERSFPSYAVSEAVPLTDDAYCWFVLDAIRRARRRVWVSMFLLDVRHAGDPGGLVRELVRALRDAAARRVDVRVMVGDSSRVLNLRDAAMVSRAFLRSRGIPTRVHPGTRGGGTHEKCVIVDDDLAILGSHNWWGESFSAAAEESLALRSPDLVAMLAGKFTDVWTAPGPGKKRDAAAGAAARREEGR